jgi:hypothetical protein
MTSRVEAVRLRSDLTTARSTAIVSTPNKQTDTPIARKNERHMVRLLFGGNFAAGHGRRLAEPNRLERLPGKLD